MLLMLADIIMYAGNTTVTANLLLLSNKEEFPVHAKNINVLVKSGSGDAEDARQASIESVL
jgi:hypothetical protein